MKRLWNYLGRNQFSQLLIKLNQNESFLLLFPNLKKNISYLMTLFTLFYSIYAKTIYLADKRA